MFKKIKHLLATIMIIVIVCVMVSCGSEKNESGTQNKTANDTSKKVGGGRGYSFVLNDSEIEVNSKVDKASLHEIVDENTLNEIKSYAKIQSGDKSLDINGLKGAYISDMALRVYSLNEGKINLDYLRFYIMDEDFNQHGYISILCKNGKYVQYEFIWQKDKFFDVIKEEPSASFVMLGSEYKEWALDSSNKTSVCNSIDPDATITINGDCYSKLSEIGLSYSYNDITAKENLIWVSYEND